MSESMLVTQALDERDLLVKKINEKIVKIKLVDTKKHNEEKTVNERVTVDEFTKTAQAAWQQITDLIERYRRLDAAIVASNAATLIETAQGSMTIAAAIALRSRLRGDGIYDTKGAFEDSLIEQAQRQYLQSVTTAENRNKLLESKADDMRMAILGRDAKTKDDAPLEVVTAFIQANTTEVIDPLGVEKKVQDLRERLDALSSELDTKIKVSNATTMIAF